METFGQALRRLRGPLSLRGLARRVHWSKSYLSDLENSECRPRRVLARNRDDAPHIEGYGPARLSVFGGGGNA